jgi:hypothetical protein
MFKDLDILPAPTIKTNWCEKKIARKGRVDSRMAEHIPCVAFKYQARAVMRDVRQHPPTIV